MNSPPNFTEWTREQKEEFAERRMREMKSKNEKLLRRYTEVENDRIEAESRNSAITNASKPVKKESNKYESYKSESKIEYAREWDRGKPDKDNWKSPEHRGSFKNYRSGYYEKKDIWSNSSRNEGNDSWHDPSSAGYQERKGIDWNDTWGSCTRNESSDQYKHDRTSEGMQNRRGKGNYRYKQYDSDQHNLSRVHKSPKRARGVGCRNNESHRNSQHSYPDEKYKRSDYNRSNSRKKYSYRAHSRSSSRSESDFIGNNIASVQISSIKAASLWQNDKISEDQNKQTRVEKWVKSVNKSNWGRGKPFPSDQKEKNRSRSYSKFERFEHSSVESSPESNYLPNFNVSGETKSRENNNIPLHQSEYHLNKRQNTGAFSHNVGSSSTNRNDRIKGFKTKCSSQYISTSSGKNEYFRKRRFDNKGFKNDDKSKFVKSVMHDNNDSWSNSVIENRSTKKEMNSNFDNADTWSQGNDDWGKPNVDDGLWETAEQSNIKWKLSDEETDLQESKIKNIKHGSIKKNSSSTWEDDFSCGEKVKLKKKYQKEEQEWAQYGYPEETWAHIQQCDMSFKSAAPKIQNLDFNSKSKSEKCKIEARGAWEECESSYNLNEISEKMERNCKIRDKMEVDGDAVDGKVLERGSNSNVEATRLEQNSCALSEKSHEENAVGSDGWSTVSEEGEIHSDDEDADSEWKKDNISK